MLQQQASRVLSFAAGTAPILGFPFACLLLNLCYSTCFAFLQSSRRKSGLFPSSIMGDDKFGYPRCLRNGIENLRGAFFCRQHFSKGGLCVCVSTVPAGLKYPV